MQHGEPAAAIHEILRQGQRSLTLVPQLPEVGQLLLTEGRVAVLKHAYTGALYPRRGYLAELVAARRGGLRIEEYSHGLLDLALAAGAQGLPYLPSLSGLGADYARVNPGNIRRASCPFTGAPLQLVSAIVPDLAVVHVQREGELMGLIARRHGADHLDHLRAEADRDRDPVVVESPSWLWRESVVTSSVPPYSMIEQMVCATSRLIRNGEVVYVGVGMPVISVLLAKRTHAPDCTIVLETGIVRTAGFPLPALLDTLGTQARTDVFSGAGYVNALAQRGRIDLGIIGAGEVDRFGNVNSTVVGPFDAPVLRWPGAGGACEIASLCGRFIVVVNQKRQRFPLRVEFVSAPGRPGPTPPHRLRLKRSCGSCAMTSTRTA